MAVWSPAVALLGMALLDGAAAACTASTLSGYACMQTVRSSPSVNLHWLYSASSGKVDLALEGPGTGGWMGLGFPSSASSMPGAKAYINTQGASTTGWYSLACQAAFCVSAISSGQGFTFDSAAADTVSGRKVVKVGGVVVSTIPVVSGTSISLLYGLHTTDSSTFPGQPHEYRGGINDVDVSQGPDPTVSPTSPSHSPTQRPTQSSPSPTLSPATSPPTRYPTAPPVTSGPTQGPTAPTGSPTSPSGSPSAAPTVAPTRRPTTSSPSLSPTRAPATSPPSSQPTRGPTKSPEDPTTAPSRAPTAPTGAPTRNPTGPTASPTVAPTSPTAGPSASPTRFPSVPPTVSPSLHPSGSPTRHPTAPPTEWPTQAPLTPTGSPTMAPTAPTQHPTAPTREPTTPTRGPTGSTESPTGAPATGAPSAPPTTPSSAPSARPSAVPTAQPSMPPSAATVPPTGPSVPPPGLPTDQVGSTAAPSLTVNSAAAAPLASPSVTAPRALSPSVIAANPVLSAISANAVKAVGLIGTPALGDKAFSSQAGLPAVSFTVTGTPTSVPAATAGGGTAAQTTTLSITNMDRNALMADPAGYKTATVFMLAQELVCKPTQIYDIVFQLPDGLRVGRKAPTLATATLTYSTCSSAVCSGSEDAEDDFPWWAIMLCAVLPVVVFNIIAFTAIALCRNRHQTPELKAASAEPFPKDEEKGADGTSAPY
eukprot:TRINITY_DN70599_c0_g1_i1.p1 TRINITY_DN70599_c0_g1~~TRINITY_DN70599_c0_g1_i1.p1  ORF type:complete len:709 (+),score=114.80 TRINITY_DN70599_c0_g1_i1:69-2195(+)